MTAGYSRGAKESHPHGAVASVEGLMPPVRSQDRPRPRLAGCFHYPSSVEFDLGLHGQPLVARPLAPVLSPARARLRHKNYIVSLPRRTQRLCKNATREAAA